MSHFPRWSRKVLQGVSLSCVFSLVTISTLGINTQYIEKLRSVVGFRKKCQCGLRLSVFLDSQNLNIVTVEGLYILFFKINIHKCREIRESNDVRVAGWIYNTFVMNCVFLI